MDVNIKGPALEKLLDYAASGIGSVAGPMLETRTETPILPKSSFFQRRLSM